MASIASTNNSKKIALIMGVANSRSIAWACVESFLRKDYDCIITYHSNIDGTKIQKLVQNNNNNIYNMNNNSLPKPSAASNSDVTLSNNNNNNSNNDNIEINMESLQKNGGTNNDADDQTFAYDYPKRNWKGRVLGCIPCNVVTDIPSLFQERIPELLHNNNNINNNNWNNNNNSDHNHHNNCTPKIDAIVHSIAYADMMMTNNNNNNNNNREPVDGNSNNKTHVSYKHRSVVSSSSKLYQASWDSYHESQHISSYSLIETANYGIDLLSSLSSITALTYIGSTRVVPNYHLMGIAKASLEAIVRGLAVDLGSIRRSSHPTSNNNHNVEGVDVDDEDDMNSYTKCIRVNAVSAGPIKTAAARGIPGFGQLYNHVAQNAPIKRNITPFEVAETVTWLASPYASGITGQTIYVDGGYSAVVPMS